MLTPLTVFAQNDAQTLIKSVGDLVGNLIPIFFGIALVVFLWGLTVFILNAGDEKRLSNAKTLMFWGIIVLFVTTSTWGIVVFLQTVFGVDGVNTIPIIK